MANPQRPRRAAGPPAGTAKRWLLRLGLVFAGLPSLLLLALAIAFRLPASMLGTAVASFSDDAVRLVLASGQLGSGRAELWVRDATGREWQPWLPVEWTLAPEWRAGDPALLLVSNLGTLRFGRAGVSISGLRINLPPNLLLGGVKHPLAKAPWRGDVELVASRLDCDWAGMRRQLPSCDGLASLHWRGMGSAILPLQEIGSYAASIVAQSRNGGRWRADVETASGVVKLAGFAEVVKGAVTYRLRIKADGHLLEGLDNIAGRSIRRLGTSGEFVLEN